MATSLIARGGNQSCMHFHKTFEKNTRSTFDKFDNMDADNKSPGNIEVFIYNKEMFRAI